MLRLLENLRRNGPAGPGNCQRAYERYRSLAYNSWNRPTLGVACESPRSPAWPVVEPLSVGRAGGRFVGTPPDPPKSTPARSYASCGVRGACFLRSVRRACEGPLVTPHPDRVRTRRDYHPGRRPQREGEGGAPWEPAPTDAGSSARVSPVNGFGVLCGATAPACSAARASPTVTRSSRHTDRCSSRYARDPLPCVPHARRDTRAR